MEERTPLFLLYSAQIDEHRQYAVCDYILRPAREINQGLVRVWLYRPLLHCGGRVPASPNRHLPDLVRLNQSSAIDGAIDTCHRENTVVFLREQGQIRRRSFQFFCKRAFSFAVLAMAVGATRQILRALLVQLIRASGGIHARDQRANQQPFCCVPHTIHFGQHPEEQSRPDVTAQLPIGTLLMIGRIDPGSI